MAPVLLLGSMMVWSPMPVTGPLSFITIRHWRMKVLLQQQQQINYKNNTAEQIIEEENGFVEVYVGLY